MKRRSALRADTTVVPAGEPCNEVYVHELPTCCLRSLKEATLGRADGNRSLDLECSCGKRWWITSSLDDRILERFVTHGGPRVAGNGPSAA